MTHFGNLPIYLSSNIKLTYKKHICLIEGPYGKLNQFIPKNLILQIINNKLYIKKKDQSILIKTQQGLIRSLLINKIFGVEYLYTKKIELSGIGYTMKQLKNKLICNLGYSHLNILTIPKELKIQINEQILSIKGLKKEKISLFAAKLKQLKKKDSYKGKGFRAIPYISKLKVIKSLNKKVI